MYDKPLLAAEALQNYHAFSAQLRAAVVPEDGSALPAGGAHPTAG
jgi:hypothetical protein